MNRFKREIQKQLSQHGRPSHAGVNAVVASEINSQQRCNVKAGTLASLSFRNVRLSEEEKYALAARQDRQRIVTQKVNALKHLKMCQQSRDLHPRIKCDLIAQARRQGSYAHEAGEVISFLWQKEMATLKAVMPHYQASSVLKKIR